MEEFCVRSDVSVTAAPDGPNLVRFEEFTFDLETRELWRGANPVDLPPQPANLLTLLVRRPGRLVTRQEIKQHVWEESVVEFDQAINNVVRQVRDILGDDASNPRFIATVPRRGYRFVATVEPAEEAAERPRSDAAAGEVVGGAVSGRRRGFILAVFVAVLALTAWMIARPASDDRSVVAVVPARTSVSDSAAEPLAKAMTATATSALEGIESESLEIVPWTAQMWYDRETHSVMRGDRAVEVDYAVELNVYDEAQVEISVSLVGFPGGRQVWYRRFEHPKDETERAVERAATALAEAVGAAIRSAERTVTPRGSETP